MCAFAALHVCTWLLSFNSHTSCCCLLRLAFLQSPCSPSYRQTNKRPDISSVWLPLTPPPPPPFFSLFFRVIFSHAKDFGDYVVCLSPPRQSRLNTSQMYCHENENRGPLRMRPTFLDLSLSTTSRKTYLFLKTFLNSHLINCHRIPIQVFMLYRGCIQMISYERRIRRIAKEE